MNNDANHKMWTKLNSLYLLKTETAKDAAKIDVNKERRPVAKNQILCFQSRTVKWPITNEMRT